MPTPRSPPPRSRRGGDYDAARRWCRTAGSGRQDGAPAPLPPPPPTRRPQRGRRGRVRRAAAAARAAGADRVVSPLPRALRTADGRADRRGGLPPATPAGRRRRRRRAAGGVGARRAVRGGGRGRPGRGGRAVGRRRPAHRAAAAAAERGTNPAASRRRRVDDVGSVRPARAQLSCCLHPCAGARPLRRAVALDARAARGGDRLVSHESLLFHMLRVRRHILRGSVGPCIVVWVVARAGWSRVGWQTLGLETRIRSRWLSDRSAPFRPALQVPERRTTSAG